MGTAHHPDGAIGKPLRIKVAVLGKGENDAREREPGQVHRHAVPADCSRDPRPSKIKCLSEGLQLVWLIVLTASGAGSCIPRKPNVLAD